MNNVIGSIILEGGATAEDTIITDKIKNYKGKDRVVAEGTLQDMDVENRNRRIYSKADLMPEINGPRMKELIKAKDFKGELGHPLTDDLVRQQNIDPKLVCVSFTKIWVDGNKVKGQFKGTNNAYGDEFDLDLREGCKPAFSLRALGSIENIGGKAYVKNIKIITYDRVIFPSHRVAYTEKIVSESAIIDAKKENDIYVINDDPGRIIKIKDTDARTIMNKLQRESANLDKVLNTFDGIMDQINLVNESTVMMTSRFGDKFYINLENHIDNLIMEFAMRS